MSRFIVVRGLNETISGANTGNWLVVDTETNSVFADCGDQQSRADTTAAALNEHVA